MAEYKKNHFIPKSMLKYWVDPLTDHEGIHIHDIRKGKTYVATGKGGSAFSFAIGRDLYVVASAGLRAVGLERWFSNLEAALSPLARQAHVGAEPLTFKEAKDLTRALMAAISLECRSPYVIRRFEKALEGNPELRGLISPEANRPVAQQVLENIIHQVEERLAAMSPVELSFLRAPIGRSWFVCDCPYFNDERCHTDSSSLRTRSCWCTRVARLACVASTSQQAKTSPRFSTGSWRSNRETGWRQTRERCWMNTSPSSGQRIGTRGSLQRPSTCTLLNT